MENSASPRLVAEEFRSLIYKRNFVLSRVEKASVKNENVDHAIWKWLKEVENLVEDHEGKKAGVVNSEVCSEMIRKINKLDDKCNFDPFYIPSQISSAESSSIRTRGVDGSPSSQKYSKSFFSKEQLLEAQEEDEIREEVIIPNPGLQSFPSGNFEYFNSTKEASEKLLQALQGDGYSVIGLYGKRGSGKTALVKEEIGKYEKIFRRVIFPIVSKNQDIKSIQEGIANSLNVHFERGDSDGVRIMKINLGLERKDGTTLVILDDFPTKSKPQELGIPCNSNRCKVLLTTRLKSDCVSMGCHHSTSIFLECLSDDEAWELLKKLSDFDPRPDQSILAQKVAFKCNGLPGLIKDVTSSLKQKSIKEWKESLESLRHSTARYQIFISFRGEDTREDFAEPLYQSLCHEGFKTFIDQEALKGGDEIRKLLEDIEESRFAIVVLSKNYADSEWCLKELVKILDCQKSKNQLVLPIFYEVPPTDVKNLRNSYAKAMAKQEKKFGEDSRKVQIWKLALERVSKLVGYEKHYGGSRDELVQKIVRFANDKRHHLHIQSMYI